MFHSVFEESGREILVASVDIKPGTLLFSEEPLITYSAHSDLFQQGYSMVQVEFDAATLVRAFKASSPETREKYLQVYYPNPSPFEGYFRSNFISADLKSDADLWVKIFCILKHNSYHSGHASIGVFEMMSKVKHSCVENVVRTEDEGGKYACRSVAHIKTGEPLTIAHVDDRALEHVTKRRFDFLMMKGFTCHCPRCDADGDDTRQFDCFDPACRGRHYVREPIYNKLLPIPTMTYNNITYEEVRLLPCTVCKRTAPQAYQRSRLQWELLCYQQLHNAYWKGHEASTHGDYDKVVSLIRELLDIALPRHHSLAHHVSHTVNKLWNKCGDAPVLPAAILALTEQGVAMEEHSVRVTEEILGKGHKDLLVRCELVAAKALLYTDLTLKKEHLQRYLRMRFIHLGRDARQPETESQLLGTLMPMLAKRVKGTAVCAFCEESPDNADMKRSRCGACKKVMYCSKGCQVQHWKIHKITCKIEDGPLWVSPPMYL